MKIKGAIGEKMLDFFLLYPFDIGIPGIVHVEVIPENGFSKNLLFVMPCDYLSWDGWGGLLSLWLLLHLPGSRLLCNTLLSSKEPPGDEEQR